MRRFGWRGVVITVVSALVVPSAAWAASGGTVTGKVVFEGTPPPVKEIQFGAEKQCALAHQHPPTYEDVVVNGNGTLRWVLVYVKDQVPGDFPAPTEPVVFDSTECLVRYLHRDGISLARVWVHDYGADRWLVSDEAFYVASPELTTPMGQGVVATASAPEAKRLAGTVHGRVMRFAQLAAVIGQTTTTNNARSP